MSTPSTSSYNEPRLEKLGHLLKSGGRCAGLIGAGSSMACGYPGWNQFLDALEVPLRAKLNSDDLEQLRKRDVRTRLDEMVSKLGDDYPRIFHETFQPKGDGRGTPEWIRLLFDLGLRLLLTTNYTVELEEASRFHPSTPLGEHPEPVRWHEQAKLDGALRHTDGRLQLIYLHGRWDDSPVRRYERESPWSQVILGESSYKYAYEHPGNVREALRIICGSHTLLVVGASLNDEDVKHTLRGVSALAGPNAEPHYVVAPLRPGEKPEHKARDWKDLYGLEAVFYDVVVDAAGKEDHGQLEDLLRDLVRRSTQRPSSVPKGDDVPVTTGVGMPHPRIVHPLLRATEFQPRPLYQQPLEEFIQRTPGGGVLALAGIGGSGKTALVREALAAVLSGSLDSKLDGVFVWSFYDEPDAAAFLRSVAGYVSGLDASADCTEVRALDLIRRHCAPTTRLLLVLDGLEKLQLERPDDRNVHGALESPTIRRLLLWLAQSTVAARAVVTTRFPLRDLEGEQRSDRVRFLDLDSLTRPQSRALLRQRGVNGEERELDVLLDHFGAHALTVDHLGGVISTYLDGNPTRYPELGDGPLTRFEAGESGKRLARVLAAYQGYLERDEPAVRAALEAFVIFPRPAGIRTVADVFLNPERSSRAGALQGKSELDLIACVRRLVELRFLRPEPLRGEVVYSIHPALRDAVLSAMGDKRIVLASVAQESVEASVARLEGRPGSPPSDPSARDLIEDLIGFCLDASHEARAYELYQQRLGGYPELGWKLGDYRRGERLARRLLEHGDQLEGMTQKRARLAVDLAMALETLGRMPEALAVYQGVLTDIGQRLPNETRSVWMVTRSHALARLLAGQLKTATAVAEQSVMVAENSRSDWWKRDSFCTRGEIRAARGFIAQAFGDFATAFSRQLMREDRPNPPYGLGGFHLQITLMRVNRVAEALVLARASLPLNEQSSWLDSVLRSRLAEVEALRRLGELDDALVNWNRVRHDVMETDYMELVAWSHLFGARLLHERADREAAWREAEEGLRTAETCGFGLLAIDFRNQLGQMLLDAGNAASAARFASEALARARHEECGYFWGQLQAHDTLALLRGNGSEATEASEHERQALAMRKQVAVTDDMVRPLLPTSWRELVGAFAKNYARFQRRAQQGEARSNLMAIRTAFRSIYQERDRYPGSFSESNVSPVEGSRYVYLLSPEDVVGGDASPKRQELLARAWKVLREHGIRPRAEPQSFLAAAVADLQPGLLDVWIISDTETHPINIVDGSAGP